MYEKYTTNKAIAWFNIHPEYSDRKKVVRRIPTAGQTTEDRKKGG